MLTRGHHPRNAYVDAKLDEQRKSPTKSWMDSLFDSRNLAHPEKNSIAFPCRLIKWAFEPEIKST